MPTAVETLEEAIEEVTRARTLVFRLRTRQVRGIDELATLRTIAYAWFNKHRLIVEAHSANLDLSSINRNYQTILDSTARSAAKVTYLDALRDAKVSLVELRSVVLITPAALAGASLDDPPPDFSPLVGSQEMREILVRRWHECRRCVTAEAHLAAIVMMGGLLEALFVARANKMVDKNPLIKAASAPKDSKTHRTLNYQDWMLDSYLKVGHELGWITASAKQVADVLKEFRNYVHPEKELRHQVTLNFNDSAMFWDVTKALVRQLLMSAANP